MSGVFNDSGFYVRAPDSGVEAVDFPAIRAAGFRSLALNYRDFPDSTQWANITGRASAAGLWVIPWGRTSTLAELIALTEQARKMPLRAVIVNCESELFDGTMSLEPIAKATAGLDAALCTLPWVGTPPLDLALVRDLHIHLGLFPQEGGGHDSLASRDCRAHAFEAGARRVSFMLGVHDIVLPPESLFPARPRGTWVYTLDDCQSNWAQYAPQSGRLPQSAVPYTGPKYGPSSSHPQSKRSSTAKALKLALHEAGFANFWSPDYAYNKELERAMRLLQLQAGISPISGAYGRGSWEAIRNLSSANVGDTFAVTPSISALFHADST